MSNRKSKLPGIPIAGKIANEQPPVPKVNSFDPPIDVESIQTTADTSFSRKQASSSKENRQNNNYGEKTYRKVTQYMPQLQDIKNRPSPMMKKVSKANVIEMQNNNPMAADILNDFMEAEKGKRKSEPSRISIPIKVETQVETQDAETQSPPKRYSRPAKQEAPQDYQVGARQQNRRVSHHVQVASREPSRRRSKTGNTVSSSRRASPVPQESSPVREPPTRSFDFGFDTEPQDVSEDESVAIQPTRALTKIQLDAGQDSQESIPIVPKKRALIVVEDHVETQASPEPPMPVPPVKKTRVNNPVEDQGAPIVYGPHVIHHLFRHYLKQLQDFVQEKCHSVVHVNVAEICQAKFKEYEAQIRQEEATVNRETKNLRKALNHLAKIIDEHHKNMNGLCVELQGVNVQIHREQVAYEKEINKIKREGVQNLMEAEVKFDELSGKLQKRVDTANRALANTTRPNVLHHFADQICAI